MNNNAYRTVWIENENGEKLKVVMTDECGVLLGTLFVDGVPYHAFLATSDEISHGGQFVVDRDPDYRPKESPTKRHMLIAPYSA
jgi:hypothetical protein